MPLLAEVAVPVPLAHAFTYLVPSTWMSPPRPGARVLVPFGARKVVGVVLGSGEAPAPDGIELKPLAGVVDSTPALPAELLAFVREVADYYFAPIGAVLRLALPAVERQALEAVDATPDLFERLKGSRKASPRQDLLATATIPPEGSADPKLRGQSERVLARLRATGAATLGALARDFTQARAALQKLEGLGLVKLEPVARGAARVEAEPTDPWKELTPAQAEAAARLAGALRLDPSSTEPRSFLLHGVTGSGKTEVYFNAIRSCLDAGRGALVLVPEIALTPQLVARFRARFGDEVAVLHSGLGDAERLAMWKRLHDPTSAGPAAGRVRVAIGARSALFAPVPELGLVVVDEEHDASFKQEEGVRYHARDMAILRAHRARAVLVLGSATPSLESVALADRGKLERLSLPDRARSEASLPTVEIVDLKRIGAGPSGEKKISLPLHRALDATLERKEQAILFLNRRGFAPSVVCMSCGALETCPACSVSLTFHQRRSTRSRVCCHYCGFETELPTACSSCSAPALELEGLGTEKLEETIATAFPTARVARLDRDVASGAKAERVLERMRRGEIDVLVGTQMVTKGHDLPNVTLVGVIQADAALSMPDFRAAERTFQLLVQVAGRAGRHERPGKVLIQTRQPEHSAIRHAAKHDVLGFLKEELRDRADSRYPPFARVALLRIDAMDVKVAEKAAHALAKEARAIGGAEVLGPAAAPIARLRGRYRFRVMLRAAERPPLRAMLTRLEPILAKLDRRVRAIIDVDPVSML
ncbi:MAG: primosomal protein N' [Polyangiaceae bacterium]